jgi:hypothetical protein
MSSPTKYFPDSGRFPEAIEWYALDMDGAVGAFMEGQKPLGALRALERWPPIAEYMHERRNKTGSGKVHEAARRFRPPVPNSSERFRDWWLATYDSRSYEDGGDLAERGIYVFDAVWQPEGVSPLYYQRLSPESPIGVNDLAEEIRTFLESFRFLNVRFSTCALLDAVTGLCIEPAEQ